MSEELAVPREEDLTAREAHAAAEHVARAAAHRRELGRALGAGEGVAVRAAQRDRAALDAGLALERVAARLQPDRDGAVVARRDECWLQQ